MGLHRFRPPPSGRMGTLWTLASIRDAVLIEFGCMGHMLYSRSSLDRGGVPQACKFYSTHLDDMDISLGSTERLNRTVADVINRHQPPVIFLLPSSVPEIIGADLPALCKELQQQYRDTRLLALGYGGFNVSQHRGVQETLLMLARELPAAIPPTPQPTFNLIGSCSDLFRFQADAAEVIRLMEGAFGMKPLCIMTSDTSVEQLQRMGGAHLNLVLRREGEPAAKQLHEQFGTPYLAARPYGIQGTCDWLDQAAQAVGLTPNREFVAEQEQEALRLIAPPLPLFHHLTRMQPDALRLSVSGHADVVKGILSFAGNELSLPRGICWCDSPDMEDDSLPYFTEEQWTAAIQNQQNGLMMASGEALEWVGRNTELQISNPDNRWKLNPYEPPFVGFRGAVHLVSLWANELLRIRRRQ